MRFLGEATLTGFRCYEDERIALGDVNIFAGPNNVGKSALLSALRRLASVNLERHPRIANPGGAAFFGPVSHLELRPHDVTDGAQRCSLTLTVERQAYERSTHNTASSAHHRHSDASTALEQKSWPIVVRAEFDASGGSVRSLSLVECESGDRRQKTNNNHHEAEAAIRLIEMLPIVILPERRLFTRALDVVEEVSATEVAETIFTADSLLSRLVNWQCEEPSRVEQVESVVKEVLEDKCSISCHPRSKELRVAIGGAPSRSVLDVGSGIVEALVLACALTEHDGGLLLYEEPEQHYHPTVQRRIMETVKRRCIEGKWQAMLTTHSNHILDCSVSERVRQFEVRPAKGGSRIIRANERVDRLAVVMESLGARPSGMIAANTVVWVEGPSDAIYLGYFIQQRAEENKINIEPVDYCFAFFGGANLRHVRLSEKPREEVVDLFAIHPCSFVVFDSDHAAAGDVGKRYAEEFKKTALEGRVWVSAGREVENYLADEVLVWAATDKVDCLGGLPDLDRQFTIFHDQVEALKRHAKRERAAHDTSDRAKVRFARNAVQMMQQHADRQWLGRLDLKERLDELIHFIEVNAGSSTSR